MFNLFKKKPSQITLKPFDLKEAMSGPLYQKLVSKMRTWGRPENKMTLIIQLCSLDMGIDKRTPEGDICQRLRGYLKGLSDDEFERYLDGIYAEEVCECGK